ncbi:GTP 3',8-cyclase MoaA [Clostridium folliculivorans]|uniref:GTP 3',8-cyclase n=1 Tax=Clostridium folliculivorans TaxID=2886038 RepID=A0A9W5Y166_9CLOT|nr:GTP 3',8-cyclase MoaA [Clostridium folliculivorans]GKU24849.1 GTP 3',8-cyclase MoaA [Clostridium folliculivorans]GKU30947.1 GTP 3',8-cyclase MoaA [Clostridium folliculivorans]
MIDSHGRNINYLRISVTDLCNLRCKYCMPEKGIKKTCHDEILRFEEIEEIVKKFVSLGIKKIRITGGEPLVRAGIITLIEKLSKLKGIEEIAMTTNGTLLKKYAKELKEAGLTRVNISLDTLVDEKYRTITKGGILKEVLEGISEAKKVKLTPIKLNVVLIKDFNEDEIMDFIYLTKDEEIDVRFIELMPIGQLKQWSLNRYLSNEIVIKKVPELIQIESRDISSPARHYRLPDGKGNVGLINPISCKFCSNCNRIRLTADGKLKACLHSNNEIYIKGLMRDGKDITEVLYNIVKHKPKEHGLENGEYIEREMTAIGG